MTKVVQDSSDVLVGFFGSLAKRRFQKILPTQRVPDKANSKKVKVVGKED
jgi:hypothetical protein